MQKERAGYSKRMILSRWTPGGEPVPSVLPPRSAGTREPPHTGFRAGSTSARTSERAGALPARSPGETDFRGGLGRGAVTPWPRSLPSLGNV